MKLGFAGTPVFAQTALAALHAAGHHIAVVLTQPDRPAGRGQQLQQSAVKQWALAHQIEVMQPASLKVAADPAARSAEQNALMALIQAHEIDALIVAAYGLILPPWVLQWPPKGALNVHASLLPRWRGAAPIQRAIEAGDSETGITIMQMDAGLDTGPIRLMRRLPIAPEDHAAEVHDRLALLGGQAIVEALSALEAGTATLQPQPEAGVRYAHKIQKSESPIDWALPAQTINAQIRAFDPVPGKTLKLGAEWVKVWAAQVRPGAEPAQVPGTISVSHGEVLVACGRDALQLVTVQWPGGKRVPASSLINRGGLPPTFH